MRVLNNGPPFRKASKSWWLTSKEPLVSKPVLWLELDTLFSPDINVLLEGTPPQAHPVTVRGRRNKGTLCAPESDIKHNGLCMHAHSQQKVIHQIV